MLPVPVDDFSRQCVIVGQSGSGKTGLTLGIMEEVALSRVPVLALDPKADLTNAQLVFPRMQGDDFLPLLPSGDPAEAAALADRQRQGLLNDGINDLHTWQDRVVVRILTPGGDAAPVDVVSTLATCPAGLDAGGRRDWITGAVAALLALIGHEADPHTDPASILLAQLYTDAFDAGEDLPFDLLLPRIVNPPFERSALFPLDEAFPPKARKQLAIRLNHLLASPAFAPWRTGVPLDPAAWLAPVDGKTPITILTLAHLPDAQRSFFVTLFLHATIAWKRRLAGTSKLRALIVLDEATGYLPPHPADPPTKAPFITLFRQSRAYGVGVLVATQHPVDLDYRALSNAGLWFVGRLQTEHDRDRVLQGMGGARYNDVLSTLAPREFLLRDTSGTVRRHRARHTRSWLRGPLTQAEITRLTQGWTPAPADTPWPTLPPDRTSGPPPMPTGLRCAWLPKTPTALAAHLPADNTADWIPAIYARIEARVTDEHEEVRRVRHRLWLDLAAPPLAVDLPDDALIPAAQPGTHALLPTQVDTAPELASWEEAARDQVAQHLVVRRFVGADVRGALGEPETSVTARHPGVPLTPHTHRPARRDVLVAWFGVVWIPTRQP